MYQHTDSTMLKNDIFDKINRLPEASLVELLDFVEFLDYKRQFSLKQSKQYDFSDLSGCLQWQGDALQTQKRLRDEW